MEKLYGCWITLLIFRLPVDILKAPASIQLSGPVTAQSQEVRNIAKTIEI